MIRNCARGPTGAPKRRAGAPDRFQDSGGPVDADRVASRYCKGQCRGRGLPLCPAFRLVGGKRQALAQKAVPALAVAIAGIGPRRSRAAGRISRRAGP
jgi:hypothetical protein